MMNNRLVLLKDISHIRTGYAVRAKLPEDPNGSMSVLQMKDVQPEGIDWLNLTRINPTGKREAYYLNPEDIVFCGRGTKIFAVPVIIETDNIVAGQQFFVITPKEGILSEYIAWYINSRHGQKYFWKNAGGSSIINVTKEVLDNCPVFLPSNKDLITITELIRAEELEWQKYAQLKRRRQELLEGIVDGGLDK